MPLLKKVCVVGAGNWGKNHIRTLHELRALGAIVDSDSNVIKQLSSKYPGIKTYTKLDIALSCNDFFGYIVATPAETHFEIAKKIIKARKHVLVEKPFTLNIEDANQLGKLAKKNNVNVMVGHVMLFHPAIIRIKKLIMEGKIGKIQYIYSNRLNLGQVRMEENVFWSLAPHDVSIFQYFTGLFPKKIIVKGSTFLQKRIHDSTLTILEYPDNVNGHIFVSWLHPFKEHRVIVIGSKGMLTFEDSLEGKPLKFYAKKYKFDRSKLKKVDGPVRIINYERKMPLSEELKYFIDHLDGSEIKVANVHHALEVTKILVKAGAQLEK